MTASFDDGTLKWFAETIGAPTNAQTRAWAAIASGQNTLLAAPTGSGKTLAAFLWAIDGLAREEALPDETRVLYISPLKALANDVAKNLDAPLEGISDKLGGAKVRTAVRTGDTPQAERARMVRRPPHILVTTPEGFYALLTSEGGRSILRTVRTAIIDEIHALAPDRRGAHLALSLERLDALAGPVQRIGLSATQRPVDRIAAFLTGDGGDCTIIDDGHRQKRDIALMMPTSPLTAVIENEAAEAATDGIARLIGQHRSTIVFVNARRHCERLGRALADRLGTDRVATHHGSLSLPLRQDAEARLKRGDLRALVATASLELGIDIGDVDLVIQMGATKRIGTFLQRVGRANHRAGGVPKARIVPQSRDDLVEAVALLGAVASGELDAIAVPEGSIDVLAQHIVAATSLEPWDQTALFEMVRQATPYRDLPRATFDQVLAMLREGFATERGRRGQLVHLDQQAGTVIAARGAKMTALTAGGVIPDSGDYTVRLHHNAAVVGAIAEDFAIHQVPGHVIQLGTATWRILKVGAGEVLVEPAPGEAPYMPVWFGDLPARSPELSAAVSALRERVAEGIAPQKSLALSAEAIGQLISYVKAVQDTLGAVPTLDHVLAERFVDQAGTTHVVVHAPVGVRIMRAWALAVRSLLSARFKVEVQAAAIDDGFIVSLPGEPAFDLAGAMAAVEASTVRQVVTAAVVDAPMFMVHWRRVAARALLVPRIRGGRRVPPHIQRMNADELLLSVMPGAPIGHSLRMEGRDGGNAALSPASVAARDISHPLVRQTLHDCLDEAMDVTGLEALLQRIEAADVTIKTVERPTPSPAAAALVTAKPPAFLDNAALMDRRTRAVSAGPRHLELTGNTAVHPEAVAAVRAEVTPDFRSVEDLAAHLSLAGVITRTEAKAAHKALEKLIADGAAIAKGGLVISAEWRMRLSPLFPGLGPREGDGIEALKTLLRARMETSGPICADAVAATLGLQTELCTEALERLVAEGTLLKGAFDPVQTKEVYCDRRVLSRIERLTRNKLRAEVEPVTLQDFARFLLHWQGIVPDSHDGGRLAVEKALITLDGLALPAGLWEESVLPARVARYDRDDLDELCLSGRFGWGRVAPPANDRAPTLTAGTPIALFDADNIETWRGLSGTPSVAGLRGPASVLLDHFEARGASFLRELRGAQLMKSEVESGLMALVAAGFLTADSFAGLRGFLSKPNRTAVSRLTVVENGNAGRFALLPRPERIVDPVAHERSVETFARALVRRYGVVVRAVVEREGPPVRWTDILRVLRRLEAQGEVRGGYFVDGAGGEHFAAPEALPLLRRVRRDGPDGSLTVISTADPLNLTALLTPGRRVKKRATARLLMEDAMPIAVMDRDGLTAVQDHRPIASHEAKLLMGRGRSPFSAFG